MMALVREVINRTTLSQSILNVTGVLNKIIVAIMWIPGLIKTKLMFKEKTE